MARTYKKLRRKIKFNKSQNRFIVNKNRKIYLTPAAVSTIIHACTMPDYEKEKIFNAMKQLEQG